MIVTDDTGQLKAWIEDKIRSTVPNDFKDCSTLGVARNGELICGVAYWFYPTGVCDVGIASTSPRWATKQTIFTLFAYPFKQVGVNRLQAFIHPKNKRSRRLCEGVRLYDGRQVEEVSTRCGYADICVFKRGIR